jgi:hypothetical protein
MACFSPRTFASFLALALAAFLGSCAEYSVQHSGALQARGSALIAVPLDARYDGSLYEGSGRETAQVVAAAFRKRVRHVEIMEGSAFSRSMDSSGGSRFDYLVIPTIIQWEDETVRRSQRENHVEIGIRVLRARDGATLAEWRVKKPSKVSTMFETSPAKQLAEPIEEYVRELFSREGI